METFSTYKQKLTGYQDVSETVKVIEKIAASALHETNRGMDALASYTKHLCKMVDRITFLQNSLGHINTQKTKTISDNALTLVFTGDKGLVGDMWKKLYNTVSASHLTDVLVFGKKGMHLFPKNSRVMHYEFQQRIPTQSEINTLATICQTHLQTQRYTIINMAHIKPVSLLEQKVEISQLLPIVHTSNELELTPANIGYPIIGTTLDKLQVLLSERYLQSRLRQVILETAISEFSARTVAMEHAGSKTDEARTVLRQKYSKDRRQYETQKQLERFASNHINV